MLTPRAIMAGQYRLVLSTGGINWNQGTGSPLGAPRAPQVPNSSEFEQGAFRDLE